MGTAVPVQSLVAYLTYWLQLPADGRWAMYVHGVELVALQILDEFEPQTGFAVSLGRVES